VVDLTCLNETMIKVLKREIITFDLSDNENDDESISLSSPIISTDESEQDEKIVFDSSSTSISKTQRKKVNFKKLNFISSNFFSTISHFIIFMNIHQIH
jgi:hypothetical protein